VLTTFRSALDRSLVRRWDRDGGTNFGSSRTNPFQTSTETGEPVDRSPDVIENVARLGLDAIVACGGGDTLGVAARLSAKSVWAMHPRQRRMLASIRRARLIQASATCAHQNTFTISYLTPDS
jgi:hypothetical protein